MNQLALGASFVTLSGTGFVEPSRFAFDERLAAAKAAGFDSIGVRLDDLERVGIDRVLTLPERYGLDVTEVEFLSGWALTSDASIARERVPLIRRLADAWGPFHVTSGEFDAGVLDIERAAANLGEIARPLAASGVRLAVEAFAWSAISGYELALDLIRRSGASNVGLMLDIWHLVNTGGTTAWIAGLQPEWIAAMQLNDGPRVYDDFQTQARATRRLPGDGELGAAEIVDAARAIGFTGPYLVEASYPEFLALPLDEAAALAARAGRAVLAGVTGCGRARR